MLITYLQHDILEREEIALMRSTEFTNSPHARKLAAMAAAQGQGPGPGRGPGRGGRGGGRGRRGRQVEPTPTTPEELSAWFAGNVPDEWFTTAVSVVFDRDEIIVTGTLAVPKLNDGDDVGVASRARIAAFREDTREHRISIAERAEAHYLRKVSWAVECGEEHHTFTSASVPVMTRLHLEDRATLDTLIDAGVARSRSEALAWCVRLVADNESDWIEKLRAAMTDLEALRDEGPASS